MQLPESSAYYRMNRPTGTLSLESGAPVNIQWKVTDYFEVPEETSRIFISPNFIFMHTGWRLALVASGSNSATNPGWIGLNLLWDGSTATTRYYRVTLNMGIERHDGTVFRSWRGVGDRNRRDWGPAELVRRSDLLEADGVIAPDRVLRIFCVLSAEKIETAEPNVAKDKDKWNNNATEKNSPKKETPKKITGVEKLLQNFKDLMLNGDESDITLRVQGREFKSHRAVLAARSPVFAAMLRHDMREKSSGEVQVDDCDPAAFECFLEHLYTGSIHKLSEDTVVGLYRIADKYDIEELKVKCVDFMSCQSIYNFCDVITLATQFDESELLEKAITFFSENIRQIIATEKWQEFLKDNTEIGNKLLMEALDRASENKKS